MNAFEDAAYTMAALTATVALFRALVRKGVLTRDEAVRLLLDEAVSRAIQAEAPHAAETTNDVNRQCAEILKFIASSPRIARRKTRVNALMLGTHIPEAVIMGPRLRGDMS